ncbi:MAG: hypothetical protein MUF04_05400 [Akkermansiaceae bacterium]|jgi:hypothetical protein|nr:hypothetical protein [Akkermansiaceae bacterium]
MRDLIPLPFEISAGSNNGVLAVLFRLDPDSGVERGTEGRQVAIAGQREQGRRGEQTTCFLLTNADESFSHSFDEAGALNGTAVDVGSGNWVASG